MILNSFHFLCSVLFSFQSRYFSIKTATILWRSVNSIVHFYPYKFTVAQKTMLLIVSTIFIPFLSSSIYCLLFTESTFFIFFFSNFCISFNLNRSIKSTRHYKMMYLSHEAKLFIKWKCENAFYAKIILPFEIENIGKRFVCCSPKIENWINLQKSLWKIIFQFISRNNFLFGSNTPKKKKVVCNGKSCSIALLSYWI